MTDCLTLDNCTILTVDKGDRVYAAGRLVIRLGKILRVGNVAEVSTEGEVVDLGGALLMPGLVNAHTHSHSSIFRGLGDDLSLMDWLQKAVWPLEKGLTAEGMYAAASLSCLEYIRGGITTYADQMYFADAAARAAQKSGLRCFLAATVFSGPSSETDDTFAAAEQFVEKWQGREKETGVYPCIGPHAPYSVDAEHWKRVIALAHKHNLLLHTHISETRDENERIKKETGLSPTGWLEKLGVFTCPTLAAHSIHLDDADLAIYEKYRVAVAYNPVSNLKLVSGIMPLKALQERGIVVGIGTDGAQSNNSMDILRDLRTGALIQKQWNKDAAFFKARDAVRMATIEGAKALHIDAETGSLEEGKDADLIALNPRSPRLVPLYRESNEKLYSAVCYAACGSDVMDVMRGGKWLMRDGVVQTLNEEAVLHAGQRASEEMVAQTRFA